MVKHRSNEYTLEQGINEAEGFTVENPTPEPVETNAYEVRIARLEAVQLLILAHLDPSGTSASLKVPQEEGEVK